MKDKVIWIIIGIIIAGLLVLGVVFNEKSSKGLTYDELESDARIEMALGSEWLVVEDSYEEIVTLLFYKEDYSDHTFLVYVSDPSYDNRYFFRKGGTTGIERELYYSDYIFDKAMFMISYNKDRFKEMTYESEGVRRIVELNPDEPIIKLLPFDTELQGFSDGDGYDVLLLTEVD